ncbi:MAG TPA: FAD-binding protein, partial [Flavobacteriales bacterium]|nr:FAD-binding protein [Flavobacteriales bacterium]
MSNTLEDRIAGPVLDPTDPSFAAEIAAFNLATVHAPQLVACATSTADMAEAVRFARAQGWSVSVQGAGHGAYTPITEGLLLTTKRMNSVRIDPEAQLAYVGAGTPWSRVVAEAAPH